jgi:hypothetical protein
MGHWSKLFLGEGSRGGTSSQKMGGALKKSATVNNSSLSLKFHGRIKNNMGLKLTDQKVFTLSGRQEDVLLR